MDIRLIFLNYYMIPKGDASSSFKRVYGYTRPIRRKAESVS